MNTVRSNGISITFDIFSFDVFYFRHFLFLPNLYVPLVAYKGQVTLSLPLEINEAEKCFFTKADRDVDKARVLSEKGIIYTDEKYDYCLVRI